MLGPQWSKTMLIWTYDEWGGWYDHVPTAGRHPARRRARPCSCLPIGSRAVRPYGFRVPGGVVSPFAQP